MGYCQPCAPCSTDTTTKLVGLCLKEVTCTSTYPDRKGVKEKHLRTLIPPSPTPSPPLSPHPFCFKSQALLGSLANVDESNDSSTSKAQEVQDMPRVCQVLVVDDGSSLEDRAAMMSAFPRFTYVFKGAGDAKGGKCKGMIASVPHPTLSCDLFCATKNHLTAHLSCC